MSGCPVCQTGRLVSVLRTQPVPVQVGRVWDTWSRARDAAVASIELAVCPRCGFVSNTNHTSAPAGWAPGYDVSMNHSAVYRRYVAEEVRLLVEEHGVHDASIVEIGCGDGYFLRELCREGRSTGSGFDPALEPGTPGGYGPGSQDVTLYPSMFDAHLLGQEADVVVMRSVLELVSDPVALLRDVRRALGDSGLLYAEVPNASWLLGNNMTWNMHFEHCSYFTGGSLSIALGEAGLTPTAVEPCYVDGQYLRALAAPGPVSRPVGGTAPGVMSWSRSFASSYIEDVRRWTEAMATWRSAGERVAVWGVGARGTSFLAACDPNGTSVTTVVDANPRRQGAFLPTNGHRILAPEAAVWPDHHRLLVTNATYRSEIAHAASVLGFAGETCVL